MDCLGNGEESGRGKKGMIMMMMDILIDILIFLH